MTAPPPIRFDVAGMEAAADAWSFNCGPAALCAVFDLTPEEARHHMGEEFARKGYTNPTLMNRALRSLGAEWTTRMNPICGEVPFPAWGLARIQWSGPWTKPGVPIAARYRKTHWVAAWRNAVGDAQRIFDVNAVNVGGWISLFVWKNQLVPWLLQECVPRADGRWWITHCLEVAR